MPRKPKVAVIKTKPETVLEDTARLMDMADFRQALDPGTATILKDNISWHFPYPGANTTPWQLEGTIMGLRDAGYEDLVCVQNNTVVTDPFVGERLNKYVPVLQRYNVPTRYNCVPDDLKWVHYEPKGRMLVLPSIYPEGIRIPEFFLGKNIVHLPTVKCVSGDTEVMFADGSPVTIRNLVARQMANSSSVVTEQDGDRRVSGAVEILAMGPSGGVESFTATWFWRTAARGRRVVRVRTRTGRTITATADHLVHTPGGWTALGDLEPGARVAIARRLRVGGASQPLPRTHAAAEVLPVTARAGHKYDAAFSQQVIDSYQGGATVTLIAEQSAIRWQVAQSILERHGVPLRRNVNQLQIPGETSPGFWRWMGYVMAEGCVERGETSDKLWWTNSEPAIQTDYTRLTRELFGLQAKAHKRGVQFYTYSKNLGRFLEELGLPIPLSSGNKRVPEILFRCPDEEIAAFLSGYLDGDGTVSRKQAEISAVTKSPQLAHDLQVLFNRLGAVAFCRPVQRTLPGKWDAPRTYYSVTVSGEGLVRLSHWLRFNHPEKQRRLSEHARRFAASKQPSNWDTVPVSPAVFSALRRGLGLTQQATGKPASANNIEHGYVQPTPRIARHFVDVFCQGDSERRFSREIDRLRSLASDDLAWDIVEAVDEVENEEVELFDLTVPGADSFVANGLIVHNCHIYTTTTGAMKNAFGGLLNTKRHYTHSVIHETLVDLLTIQKEIHSGLFAVMDGTTCGNGPGPRTMIPVEKDYMLASADQVAIDAVASKMMGFDPMSLPYIRLAHDAGLGVGDPRDIEVVGEDVSDVNFHFTVGDNAASRVGDLMWFGPMRPFQKLFFRTPLVYAFVFGSAFYHDQLWYRVKGQKVVNEFTRNTKWGRLFDKYEAAGARIAQAVKKN
jgi:hypothetical protein